MPDHASARQATDQFIEKVRQLPGILRLEVAARLGVGERMVEIYVARGDICARERIYDLESELYSTWVRSLSMFT
jgi:hypothetical protein